MTVINHEGLPHTDLYQDSDDISI